MYDISAIKKLPVAERLKIIDELLNSIEKEEMSHYTTNEEASVVKERIEKYEKGQMKFDSWKNVKERLEKDSVAYKN